MLGEVAARLELRVRLPVAAVGRRHGQSTALDNLLLVFPSPPPQGTIEGFGRHVYVWVRHICRSPKVVKGGSPSEVAAALPSAGRRWRRRIASRVEERRL